MSLSFQVFETPSLAVLLADFTHLLHPEVGGGGLRFSTNKHGAAACEAPLIPQTLEDAFRVYDWPGTPHVVVSDEAAGAVWEGRLEDAAIVPGGVRLLGLGYWRSMLDVPYTALWSDAGLRLWRPATEADLSTRTPAKYHMDNNGRLYISLRKNEIYGNGIDIGSWAYLRPHNSNRSDALRISFDYDVTLPTDWYFRTRSYDEGFTGGTAEVDILLGDGANHTGSHSDTITSGKEIIVIEVQNTTGGNYTNSGESDDWFVKITNVRVTTAATPILASTIAASLVTFVNGINSTMIQDDDSLIEATTTDLLYVYRGDLYPADLLDWLALLHNYEVGVWENRRLHFREKDSQARDWYVDVTRILNLERSLEPMRNSAYGVYRDANGRALRTAVSDDAASQTRYGLVRRGFVNVSTTSQTEAETHRDTFLADRKDFALRAEIEFGHLYDAAGAEYPLYALRAGDTLTMRNLPPTLSADIDNIRSFRVGETDYEAVSNSMAATPEEGIPTLVRLVARSGSGIWRPPRDPWNRDPSAGVDRWDPFGSPGGLDEADLFG